GSGGAGGSDGGGEGTLTFRLWDENAVPAYEESFQAFTEQHGWEGEIDLVPWGDYWTRLPLDVASGDAADVYWMNSANYILYKDSEDLLDINEVIPDGASQWSSPWSICTRATAACGASPRSGTRSPCSTTRPSPMRPGWIPPPCPSMRRPTAMPCARRRPRSRSTARAAAPTRRVSTLTPVSSSGSTRRPTGRRSWARSWPPTGRSGSRTTPTPSPPT